MKYQVCFILLATVKAQSECGGSSDCASDEHCVEVDIDVDSGHSDYNAGDADSLSRIYPLTGCLTYPDCFELIIEANEEDTPYA